VLVTLDAARDTGQDAAGAGGYALLAESAVPVLSDLGTPEENLANRRELIAP